MPGRAGSAATPSPFSRTPQELLLCPPQRLLPSGMISGRVPVDTVLPTAFPCDRVTSSWPPFGATMACLFPFPVHPSASLGRHAPWHMMLQCLGHVAAALLCTPPPLCWQALAFVTVLRKGPDAPHAVRLGLCAGALACMRLTLLCACPPPCTGALWPMPDPTRRRALRFVGFLLCREDLCA